MITYYKLVKHLDAICKKNIKDFNKMNHENKKREKDKVLEQLIASWISNEDFDVAKEYIINEEDKKIECTGIDIAYFDYDTLYLIQVKNTDKVKSKDYSKSKCAADNIWDILIDSKYSKEEKKDKTGISNLIIKRLNEKNWIFKKKFFFVYFSDKEKETNNWPAKDELKEKFFNITNFFNWIVLNINTGEKRFKKVQHIIEKNKDWGKNVIYSEIEKNKILIFSIQANDLIKIIKKEIQEGNALDSLFEGNVRFLVKNERVNSDITESLKNNDKYFFLLNNGLSMLVEDLEFNDDRNIIRFKNCNIINGQQTTRSLYDYFLKNSDIELSNIKILIKLYQLQESNLKIKIPFATNNQNKIDIIDLMSLQDFQKKVKEYLITKDIFYIYKIGKSKINDIASFFSNNFINSAELIKLFALCYDHQLTIKNNLKKMYNEVYENIGKISLTPGSTYYHTEEAVLLIGKDDNEEIKKMLKLVTLYIKFKNSKESIFFYKKSFDIVFYTLYFFLKDEKDEFIKINFDESLSKIFKILKEYFKKEIDNLNTEEGDFFRYKNDWTSYAKKINNVCLKFENISDKIKLLEEELV